MRASTVCYALRLDACFAGVEELAFVDRCNPFRSRERVAVGILDLGRATVEVGVSEAVVAVGRDCQRASHG